jgi:uncharacterized lipoprotein YbaY
VKVNLTPFARSRDDPKPTVAAGASASTRAVLFSTSLEFNPKSFFAQPVRAVATRAVIESTKTRLFLTLNNVPPNNYYYG